MPTNLQTEMGHEQKGRVSLGFGNLYASPGDHIGHFYRTSEEEKNVLIPFLKAGLKGARKMCMPHKRWPQTSGVAGGVDGSWDRCGERPRIGPTGRG